MRQVIWTSFAIVELKNIYLYYKLISNKRIANKIKNEILLATKKLVNHSFIGQIEENLIDLNFGHRYIVQGNYKIIYLIIDESIFITDVFDCRQNPQKINSHSK